MGQSRVSKFLGLSPADRSLLIRAALLLGAARLGLWLFPLQLVRRWLAGRARPRGSPSSPTPEHIAWALANAARVVPGATCLPQALAAEALLARSGYAAEVRIGVAKTERNRLVAHAWVESAGRVVVGELRDRAQYAPLPPLPPPRGAPHSQTRGAAR